MAKNNKKNKACITLTHKGTSLNMGERENEGVEHFHESGG